MLGCNYSSSYLEINRIGLESHKNMYPTLYTKVIFSVSQSKPGSAAYTMISNELRVSSLSEMLERTIRCYVTPPETRPKPPIPSNRCTV